MASPLLSLLLGERKRAIKIERVRKNRGGGVRTSWWGKKKVEEGREGKDRSAAGGEETGETDSRMTSTEVCVMCVMCVCVCVSSCCASPFRERLGGSCWQSVASSARVILLGTRWSCQSANKLLFSPSCSSIYVLLFSHFLNTFFFSSSFIAVPPN